MLRRSFTAVLEKNTTFRSDFETEPYEVGWASEARWFVNALEVIGDTALSVTPQVSPDGLHWCDEGSGPTWIHRPGLASIPLVNFGSWLRLKGRIRGQPGEVRIVVYLALKE